MNPGSGFGPWSSPEPSPGCPVFSDSSNMDIDQIDPNSAVVMDPQHGAAMIPVTVDDFHSQHSSPIVPPSHGDLDVSVFDMQSHHGHDMEQLRQQLSMLAAGTFPANEITFECDEPRASMIVSLADSFQLDYTRFRRQQRIQVFRNDPAPSPASVPSPMMMDHNYFRGGPGGMSSENFGIPTPQSAKRFRDECDTSLFHRDVQSQHGAPVRKRTTVRSAGPRGLYKEPEVSIWPMKNRPHPPRSHFSDDPMGSPRSSTSHDQHVAQQGNPMSGAMPAAQYAFAPRASDGGERASLAGRPRFSYESNFSRETESSAASSGTRASILTPSSVSNFSHVNGSWAELDMRQHNQQSILTSTERPSSSDASNLTQPKQREHEPESEPDKDRDGYFKTCPYCEKSFNVPSEYDRHVKAVHEKSESWSCENVQDPLLAFQHVVQGSSSIDICGMCGREFKHEQADAASLTNHQLLLTEHVVEVHKFRQCNNLEWKRFRPDNFGDHLKKKHNAVAGALKFFVAACRRAESGAGDGGSLDDDRASSSPGIC